MVVVGVWDRERVRAPAEGLAEPPPGSVRTVEAEVSPPGALGRAGQMGAGASLGRLAKCQWGWYYFHVASWRPGRWDSMTSLVVSCRDNGNE